MKKILITLFSIGMLLAGWQTIVLLAEQPELIPSLPRLTETFCMLFTTGTFYQSVAFTLLRGMEGIIISLGLAVGTSILFSRHETLNELFRPLLSLMRSIPVISFILLALIFLQPENIPLIIAFLTMYPLLNENLTKGFKELNPTLSIMTKTFRIRRINRYTQVLYPQLKPFLFSGLSSAVGFGWRAIIMGEVLSQCTFGVGSEMKRAQTFIDVPTLMAWTLVAAIISILFDKGIEKLSRITIPISYTQSAMSVTHPKPKDILLQDVSKSYKQTDVLKHLSIVFTAGEIYGLSAPSGTGKSTLLNLINGSLIPSAGSITADRSLGISYVFHEPELLPHLSVLDNICLPLAAIYNKKQSESLGKQMLTLMEMEELSTRFPHELSYGQQQRTAIARALAYPSSILLMDEPFKGLDNELIRRIALHIRKLHANSNQTIIFVTHKPEELSLLANQTINLPTA